MKVLKDTVGAAKYFYTDVRVSCGTLKKSAQQLFYSTYFWWETFFFAEGKQCATYFDWTSNLFLLGSTFWKFPMLIQLKAFFVVFLGLMLAWVAFVMV